MPIIIKSEEEIATIREAGRTVGQVLQVLAGEAKPGVTGKQLDAIVRKEFAGRGVKPTFLGYMGYPASVCLSANDEVVHGIPGDRALKDGDVLSIDLGATYNGFVGDAAITVGVGRISAETERLLRTTERALYKGIEAARAGSPLGAVSHAVQTEVEAAGFSVVREYVGHGVGRAMHEDPQNPELRAGGPGAHPEKGHGARHRADGQRRRLAHEKARGRLDGQHARPQPLRPFRAHNRRNRRQGGDTDAALER